MKTVYFVRHGESEGNAGTIRLGYNGGLTAKGKLQARELGQRCAKLPISLIVSSSLDRTRETTAEILKCVPIPVAYSDLFRERRNPSAIVGLKKDSPQETYIRTTIWKRFHEPGWRYSDEENFDDLHNRARNALQFLIDRQEEQILVVGHGLFTRILLSLMVFDDALTGEICSAMVQKFNITNTGISVCFYEAAAPHWRIETWNDSAHLG